MNEVLFESKVKVDGAFFAGDFTDRGTLVSMNKFFDIMESRNYL